MGFYNSKLDNYSKFIELTQDQLDYTKGKIIEQKQKYIEELKKDMQISRRAGLDEHDFGMYEEEKLECMFAEKEMDFISTMNTLDFYQYMISLENYQLCKLEEKAISDMASNIELMQKYKTHKGLVAKTSALFGLDKKMVEKKGRLVNEANTNIDYAQDSRSEWQSLSPDSQLIYIVGRYELDGKSRFDSKGYETYKALHYVKTNENDNENTMEDDLGLEK